MTDAREMLAPGLMEQIEEAARTQKRKPAEILEDAVRQYLERRSWWNSSDGMSKERGRWDWRKRTCRGWLKNTGARIVAGERVTVDTNVLISGLVFPHGKPFHSPRPVTAPSGRGSGTILSAGHNDF